MPTGTMKTFFTPGFRRPYSCSRPNQVFVHVSALEGPGSEEPVEGRHVEFEVEPSPKGPRSKSVRCA